MRREIWLPDPSKVDFVTNDYLGLSVNTKITEAAAAAAREFGAGARASRLLGGDSAIHREAEAVAARWLGVEAALLLPTGSQANFALLGALLREGDCAFSDVQNHASLIDGLRLARARKFIYSSLDELERFLRIAGPGGRKIIITESVFSISGDVAPLAEIVKIAERQGAHVIVDEAHAAGVLGARGAGLCEREGVSKRVLARMITGGKALGAAGALVAGSRAVIDTIINFGRAMIFTTAPPPATAGALRAAIEVVAEAGRERERLQYLTKLFVKTVSAAGWPVSSGGAPIVYLRTGSADDAMGLAARVRERGLEVRAVRPPTVAAGGSGIRISIHANHTEKNIYDLAEALGAPNIVYLQKNVREPRAPRMLFVTGTDTGVGKTVVSMALLALAAERGAAVYWKPAGTGTGDDCDAETVKKIICNKLENARIHPSLYQFPEPVAPEFAAREAGVRMEREALLRAWAEYREAVEPGAVGIVEGAGGLAVPYSPGYGQEEFIRNIKIPVVVVARSAMGTINHTRLTLEALAARRIPVAGVVMCGQRHSDNEAVIARHIHKNDLYILEPLAELNAASLLDAARRAGLSRLLDPN